MRAVKSDERALWHAAMRDVKRVARKTAAPVPPPPPKIKAAPKPASPPPPLPKPAHPGVGLDRRTAQRLRRGAMTIAARLDLHGLTQKEAHDALASFIARGAAAGLRALLVVTGKSGVLHQLVPRWLGERGMGAHVLTISPARPAHGGAGALYVLLRRKR